MFSLKKCSRNSSIPFHVACRYEEALARGVSFWVLFFRNKDECSIKFDASVLQQLKNLPLKVRI